MNVLSVGTVVDSVADPFHFDMDPDPDPRIRFVKKRIRIRILFRIRILLQIRAKIGKISTFVLLFFYKKIYFSEIWPVLIFSG